MSLTVRQSSHEFSVPKRRARVQFPREPLALPTPAMSAPDAPDARRDPAVRAPGDAPGEDRTRSTTILAPGDSGSWINNPSASAIATGSLYRARTIVRHGSHSDPVETTQPAGLSAIDHPREADPPDSSALFPRLPLGFDRRGGPGLLHRVLPREFERWPSLAGDRVGQCVLDFPPRPAGPAGRGSCGDRGLHALALRGHVSDRLLTSPHCRRRAQTVSAGAESRGCVSKGLRSHDEHRRVAVLCGGLFLPLLPRQGGYLGQPHRSGRDRDPLSPRVHRLRRRLLGVLEWCLGRLQVRSRTLAVEAILRRLHAWASTPGANRRVLRRDLFNRHHDHARCELDHGRRKLPILQPRDRRDRYLDALPSSPRYPWKNGRRQGIGGSEAGWS